MAPNTPSLTASPVEILCDVFRHLDPISLISASQTNAQFRTIIKPSKLQFIERLLILECQEEVGGVTPTFKAKLTSQPKFASQLDPDPSLPQWESMRWACSGCLCLLPHEAFDNHALLQLAYRKPIPGSPAARRLSSWKPSLRGYVPSSRREKSLEQSFRRRNSAVYSMTHLGDPESLAQYKDCGLSRFQDMTREEFNKLEIDDERRILDLEAHDVEVVRCGFKRHLRKCLECRYQNGDFNSMRGRISVPVSPSRQIPVASPLDRYFPGFSQVFENKRPTCDLSYLNAGTELWTMYMIRCAHCSKWKESRALRLGNFFNGWKPYSVINGGIYRNWDDKVVTEGLMNGLLCNHCYEEVYGRKMLATEIIQWLRLHLQREKSVISSRFAGRLRYIPQSITKFPQTRQKEMHDILQPAMEFDHMLQKGEDLSDDQIALYRECYDRWAEMREEIEKDTRDDWVHPDSRVSHWVYGFDEVKAHYVWLRDILKEVDVQDPNKIDALVDWALNDSRVIPVWRELR